MKKIVCILTVLWVIVESSYGQAPYFQYYSLLKKNEPVQVNTIFQDHEGFMWYGTNKGLFSFDGIHQTRITETDSLPDNNVTALAQDSLGRIWIGHKSGALSYLENGRVKKVDPPEGLPSQAVSDILFDREGNVWFSTLDDGLYYFNNERLYRLDQTDGMPDLYIYDIMLDKDGNIWAGTDGGIAICTLKNRKVGIQVINYELGLPDNIIKKLVQDENGDVWMGTEDAGVIKYVIKSGTYKPLTDSQWSYGAITDFVIKDSTLWISCLRTGLVLFDRRQGSMRLLNSKSGPGFNSINVLSKDREGNIWAGTKTGVMRTPGNNIEHFEDLNGNILAVTVDHDNAIWFSTSEGLFKRTADEHGDYKIKPQLANTPYKNNRVISLFVDSSGFVWAGMYGEGVLRINPVKGTIQHFEKELRNGNILNITGRGNVIWLATLGGATKMQLSGEKFTVRNFSSEDGLASDYIYQIFIDRGNKVWFATDGNGAGMLDNEGFHHYHKGLNSKVVYGFAEDANHMIWLNVQGDGLYKLAADSLVPISHVKLRDNNITAFSSDEAGNLIIMHDLGIDVYDVKNEKVRYMGGETGINETLANLNAVTKDKSGFLYIGTDGGILKYSAVGINKLTSPQPVIRGMKVINTTIDLSGNLEFTYDQNSITINYCGFWYQNPENLVFEYKLENYDREWINTLNQFVTYSSLPPGDYTFKVRVSDLDQLDFSNSKEAVIQFSISPPFWRTKVFYVAGFVVIVLAGYFFLKFRERKSIRYRHILEARVKERTLEIQKQAEEIQAQNEEISSQAEVIQGINDNLELLVKERTQELEKKNKALEEYAFINAHELRGPLASIMGLINLIRKTELSDEGKTVANHLNDSAEKLNSVIRTITKAIERGDRK